MSASDRKVTFGQVEDEEKAQEKLAEQFAGVTVKARPCPIWVNREALDFGRLEIIQERNKDGSLENYVRMARLLPGIKAAEKWARDPNRPVHGGAYGIYDDIPDHMVGVVVSHRGAGATANN